jgi:hypothetical protein
MKYRDTKDPDITKKLKPFEVPVPHHKDLPQVHSRTSIFGVGVSRNQVFKDGKNFFSQFLIAIPDTSPFCI